MRNGEATVETSAEAYIARLAERGVEVVLANAGTDFAPIVEALAGNADGKRKFPRFITVPHENLAMAMAQGYYRTSGKPPVVMVHVTVGTANALCGLMNATRDNAPILLAAGRTPLTQAGHPASRNLSIHWGQELFDQGAMVRELVKWDYELRAGQPVASLVDRALDIAMSEPRGPVYLTLPREVLANPAVPPRRETIDRPLGALPAEPAWDAIERAAALIAKAEFPLIVTSSAGRAPEAVGSLAMLAEEFALPVVQSEARSLNLPTDHSMHLGFEIGTHLALADVVVVLDAVVPWVPRNTGPKPGAKVIHIAADPLASRYPYHDFEADLLVTGETRAALRKLGEALRVAMRGRTDAIEERRKVIAAARKEVQARLQRIVEQGRTQTPIAPAWMAHCVNEVKARDAIVVNEIGLPVNQLRLTEPGSYLGGNLAGGLGFGLGAGLGAKLAAPEREVIVAVGDGSFMFGNPLPYHYVARAEKLPTLTIVANNHAWQAVRNATLTVYPEGKAAKANKMSLVELNPSPAFEKSIEVCDGLGLKVEAPGELLPALKRGMDAVRSGTPALVNVITQGR